MVYDFSESTYERYGGVMHLLMSFDADGLDELLDQKGFQGKEMTRTHGISVGTANEEMAGIYRGHI